MLKIKIDKNKFDINNLSVWFLQISDLNSIHTFLSMILKIPYIKSLKFETCNEI